MNALTFLWHGELKPSDQVEVAELSLASMATFWQASTQNIYNAKLY